MSSIGQPNEALLIATTLIMGDIYGAIVEAGLNEMRSRAFLAGQQHEWERQRATSRSGKRVSFSVEASAAASAASPSPLSLKAERTRSLDGLIMATVALARLAIDADRDRPPATTQSTVVPLPPIDGVAFRAYVFRRQLRTHVLGASSTLALLCAAPNDALPLSDEARRAAVGTLSALLCLRVAAHRFLSPRTTQRYGSGDRHDRASTLAGASTWTPPFGGVVSPHSHP